VGLATSTHQNSPAFIATDQFKMNGLAAVYGNHLGAQLLGLAQAAGDRKRPPSPSSAGKRWQTPDHSRDRLQQTLEEEDGEEYEDEIIEEMSGNWPPSSSSSTATSAATQAVPRVDSVEWNKMEEGPDDETLLLDNAEPDEDGSPHRASAKSLKRKRKPAETSGGLDEHQGPGKKRLSCIDCGCRAALKACTKVMCIDCCAKEGRGTPRHSTLYAHLHLLINNRSSIGTSCACSVRRACQEALREGGPQAGAAPGLWDRHGGQRLLLLLLIQG